MKSTRYQSSPLNGRWCWKRVNALNPSPELYIVQMQLVEGYTQPVIKTITLPARDTVLATKELSAALRLAGHKYCLGSLLKYAAGYLQYPVLPSSKLGSYKIYTFGAALDWAEARAEVRETRGRPRAA